MKKIIILFLVSAIIFPQLSSAATLTRTQRAQYRAQYQSLVKELQKLLALIRTLQNRRLAVAPPAETASGTSTKSQTEKTANLFLTDGAGLSATELDREYASLAEQLANDDSWAKLKAEILAATSSPEISQILNTIDSYRQELKENPKGNPYSSGDYYETGEEVPPSLPPGVDPYTDPYTYRASQSAYLLKDIFSKLPALVTSSQGQQPGQTTGGNDTFDKVLTYFSQAGEADTPFDQAMAGLANFMKYGESGMNSQASGGAQQIYESARQAVDKLVTKNVPQTNRGRRACAWAVSTILQKAAHGVGTHWLTTVLKADGLDLHTEKLRLVASTNQTNSAAAASLAANPTVTPIAAVLLQGKTGDVIISPTVGKKVGHTGICMTDKCTKISSNDSDWGLYRNNYTDSGWKLRFEKAPFKTYLYRSVK